MSHPSKTSMEFTSPRTRLWGRKLFFGDRGDNGSRSQQAGSGRASGSFIFGRHKEEASDQNKEALMSSTAPASTVQSLTSAAGGGKSGIPPTMGTTMSNGKPRLQLPPLPGSTVTEIGSSPDLRLPLSSSGHSLDPCPFCSTGKPGKDDSALLKSVLQEMAMDVLSQKSSEPLLQLLEWIFDRSKELIPDKLWLNFWSWRHSQTAVGSDSSNSDGDGDGEEEQRKYSSQRPPSSDGTPARSILKKASFESSGVKPEPSPRRVSFIHATEEPAASVRSMASMASLASMSSRHTLTLEADAEMLEKARELQVFHGLSEEEFATVREAFEVRVFDPDSEIVGWGQKGGDLHIVQSGEVHFYVPQKVYSLNPGASFGEQLLTKQHLASDQRVIAGNKPLVTLCLTQAKYDALNIRRNVWRSKKKRSSKVLKRGGNAQGAADAEDYMSPPMSPTGPGKYSPLQVMEDHNREKTDLDIKLIMEAIGENAHLMEVMQPTQDQIRVLADQVTWVMVPVGTYLYREGDLSTTMYLIHDGQFEVTEKMQGVAKLRSGQSFGEMGLLYGARSKTSVRSIRDSYVWQLTSEVFLDVLKTKSPSRLREYMDILKQSPAFSALSDHCLHVLGEALKEQFCECNEKLVESGKPVTKLYIVFDGTLRLEKKEEGSEPQTLKHGDMFGLEQMAAQDAPQPCSLVVTSESAKLLTVERGALEVLAEMSISDMLVQEEEASDAFEDEQVNLVRSRRSSENNPAAAVGRCKSLQPFQNARMHTLAENVPPRDRLERVGFLGAGSFGQVTLEKDPVTQKQYALKAMSKGFCVQEGLQAVTVREKQIHMMLNSPFIIKLYGTYKDEQFLYFLLQPATGGDLFEVCHENSSIFGSVAHAQFFTAGLCLGLEHMHEKKIIYRDVKLENVLLDRVGYPLIADMGLAKIVLEKTYTVCGTADYMAPEILRRTGHDRAVDWWALGIFLFVLMSGRSPFDASEAAQIYRNIVKGLKKDHYPESFPKPLREVIGGLCRKKPEERLPMGSKGTAHLKESAWFAGFDWTAMGARLLEPPWSPPTKNAEDFATRKVEAPNVVEYIDDGSGWDAEF